MERPEWTYTIERTEYTDNIFARVGRLLYKATMFESYCNVIYARIYLNQNPNLFSDETAFKLFIEKLEKGKIPLGQKINGSFKGDPFKPLREILNDGRTARNEIAHSLTTSLNHIFGNSEREKEFEKRLEELSFTIVRAELLCIDISAHLFKLQKTATEMKPEINWILED